MTRSAPGGPYSPARLTTAGRTRRDGKSIRSSHARRGRRAVALARRRSRAARRPSTRSERQADKRAVDCRGDDSDRPAGAGSKRAKKAKSHWQQVKDNDAASETNGGRFTKHQGAELCFDWKRNAHGCSGPCPAKRQHVCERCKGPRRAIDDSCQAPKLLEGWRPGSRGAAREGGRPPSD